ncbi:hypothetical protein V6N13_061562 [Hibiscus sabdariffa]|uniref:Uncharacterized protein n=2 Tax=Hibiscus sabdariffa TaxID=183260 RepID=A0ABR2BEH9_9ROSI
MALRGPGRRDGQGPRLDRSGLASGAYGCWAGLGRIPRIELLVLRQSRHGEASSVGRGRTGEPRGRQGSGRHSNRGHERHAIDVPVHNERAAVTGSSPHQARGLLARCKACAQHGQRPCIVQQIERNPWPSSGSVESRKGQHQDPISGGQRQTSHTGPDHLGHKGPAICGYRKRQKAVQNGAAQKGEETPGRRKPDIAQGDEQRTGCDKANRAPEKPKKAAYAQPPCTERYTPIANAATTSKTKTLTEEENHSKEARSRAYQGEDEGPQRTTAVAEQTFNPVRKEGMAARDGRK